MSARHATIAAIVLLGVSRGPRPLLGQCPDGVPPPCRRAVIAPASDRNRIAILPFRVTTADTMLGEGVAELIALEFTGTSGPRAVHMGSLLSAWRGAGGGLRAPLPSGRAARVALAVGAGRLIEGSIVGLGHRLTLSASLVSATGGEVRRVEPVSGPADSLDALVRRLTVGLLAAAGGSQRAVSSTRLTDSPAALRAYLEGVSAWRYRRYPAAFAGFERAIELDSTFAAAAYARLRAGQYQFQDARHWEGIAWRYQDRLSTEQRIILRAGPRMVDERPMRQRFADLEEAVRLLPESPEAAYHLGDLIVHDGEAFGLTWAVRAAELLERSVRLDTQSTVFSHLLGWSARVGDSAALRRQWVAYERFLGDGVDVRLGYWVGAHLRDARLMQRYAARPRPFSYLIIVAGQEALGAAVADSMLAMSLRADSSRLDSWWFHAHAAVLQGRPAAAVRSAAGVERRDGGLSRDVFLVTSAVISDGDRHAAREAVNRLASRPITGDSTAARVQCALALWELNEGRSASVGDALRDHHQNCAAVVGVWEASRTGSLSFAALALADSLSRERLEPAMYAGFENLVLARLWRGLGHPAEALAAVRRVHLGYPVNGGIAGTGTGLSVTPSARLEGELAAMAADTAGAVRAFRRYLALRRDAEPDLVPQRDSVQRALAALGR